MKQSDMKNEIESIMPKTEIWFIDQKLTIFVVILHWQTVRQSFGQLI